MNQLKVWLRAASVPEQQALAERAGTTVQYLRRLAATKESYARAAKAELAAAIETVTADMHRESKGRLPKVLRTDLNEACRACPYAERCLRDRIIDSHFEVQEGGL